MRELRTGGYSNYLLLSELSGLPHYVQKEVREAVYRGEGLIEAGKRTQPYHPINEAHGIAYRGTQWHTGGLDILQSPLADQQNLTFSFQDRNIRFTPRGADTLAEFMVDHGYFGYSNDTDALLDNVAQHWCPPEPHASPAITLNKFGLGKSIYMGFDLLVEATALGVETNVYTNILLKALEQVNPVPALTTIGTDVQLVFTIDNQGKGTPAQLVLPIPESISVTDAGAGVIDKQAKQVVWNVELSEDQKTDIVLWVEMPDQTTSLTAKVFSKQQEQLTERATANVTLQPEEAVSFDDAIDSTRQSYALLKVHYKLKHAKWAADMGYPRKALRSLLSATNHIRNIQKRYQSEDLTALRINIDLLIKQVAKQIVVSKRRARCRLYGDWYDYEYPTYHRSCGTGWWKQYQSELKLNEHQDQQ